MKRSFIIIVLIAAALAMVTADVGNSTSRAVIRVVSPGSMFGRMHTVSKLFMKEQSGIQVDFKRSADVDAAFASLLDGSADTALTTRRISDAENESAKSKGLEITGRSIGYGGIVIVTTARNPVGELTVEQVRKIFTGEFARWNQVGGADEPVTVVRVGKTYPGTVFFMEEDFLGGLRFAANAVVVDEFANVIRKVAQTPGSVGFVRVRDAFESPIPYEMDVKIVKVRKDASSPAIQPSRSAIKDASYPIRRPYYVYYKGKPDANISKYLEFIQKRGWGQQNL